MACKGPECLPYIETIEALTDARAVDSWYTAEFFKTQQADPATLETKQRDIEEHG